MSDLTTEKSSTDLLEQLSSLKDKNNPEKTATNVSDLEIKDENEPSDNISDSDILSQTESTKKENLSSLIQSDTDGDDTDEEEDEVFKKLENNAYNNILLNYHPEIKQNNYNEILAMSKIVRNSQGIISDPMHRTIPWLTKYERSRVLGLRSKQLNYGADPFIEVSSGILSGYKIALEELNQKKIPFIIRRPIPNGGNEYWKLGDLELLDSY